MSSTASSSPAFDSRLRWVPAAMWVIAGAHTLLALTDSVWPDVVAAGVIGVAMGDDALASEAFGALYFLMVGVLFIALAHLTHVTWRTTGRLPRSLGSYLFISGVVITTVEFPMTGAWAVMVLGGYVLYVDHRMARPAP